jgi:hypothetical protein
MKRSHIVLIVISALFFVQTGLITYWASYQAQARFRENGEKIGTKHPDISRKFDYMEYIFSESIEKIETADMVGGVAGSVIGCLGALLLLLYLKIRALERSVAALRGDENQWVDKRTPPGLRL